MVNLVGDARSEKCEPDICSALAGFRGYRSLRPPPPGRNPADAPSEEGVAGRLLVNEGADGLSPPTVGTQPVDMEQNGLNSEDVNDGESNGVGAKSPLFAACSAAIGELESPKKGPTKSREHIEALSGSLENLVNFDERLGFLDSKEVSGADLHGDLPCADPMKLYVSSLAAFSPLKEIEKIAFQAVTRGDEETLRFAVAQGVVSGATTNRGGQTLVDFARTRRRQACVKILEESQVATCAS